ncbi:hypothetical protein Tco_1185442 [Tanacetum coccineum]
MSDSEDSTVTYTAISSPFGGLSYIGSPGVDGLPMMLEDPYVEAALQAPPSPDYMPGPEYSPSPEFVPEYVYPEFMPPDDKVFPAEEQGPTDYPADGGDDDNDDESSDDDEDDDDDVEEDEEEQPALADSVPPLIHRVTARISIRAQTPVSLPSDTEVKVDEAKHFRTRAPFHFAYQSGVYEISVESYQQKVNLTARTITFPSIEKKKMFSIVTEPIYGIIYKNGKKEKRVMGHQEIHKFYDATLKRVLEGLKSYNNDKKHGYVTPSLSKEDAEYLRLFEEEIEERLKHQDQMRRWEIYVNGRPLGSRRERPE